MINLSSYIGQHIQNLYLSIWTVDDESSKFLLRKVIFDFGKSSISLLVTDDSDELKLEVLHQDVNTLSYQDETLIDLRTNPIHEISVCLGLEILEYWNMKNSHGYDDGLQIMFNKERAFQFIALATTIEIREV